ncbi:MAG: GTP-binding protein [Phycisphaerales bacterium]|nr:GTP-binding protein [Phycisphaerales bacterium]
MTATSSNNPPPAQPPATLEVRRLTAEAPGAIAVIQVSGPAAAKQINVIASGCNALALQPGMLRLVHLTLDGAAVDHCLLICHSPNLFELHLHGGLAVVRAVTRALVEPSDAAPVPTNMPLATLPAAMPSSPPAPSTIEAEVYEILAAITSRTAVRMLANQLTGGLTQWCNNWLARLSANTAAEHGPTLLQQFALATQSVLLNWRWQRYFFTPPKVVLLGPPNAGKSTLMNAMLGRAASIVSDLAGTTRDYVDATGRLVHGSLDMPVILIDTAGDRTTTDAIEQAAIDRTRRQAASADVLLLVVDACLQSSAATLAGLASTAQRNFSQAILIPILNKADLLTHPPNTASNAIAVSAKQGLNMDALTAAIFAATNANQLDEAAPVAFTLRQRLLLNQAASQTNLTDAIILLRQLTGTPA